MNFGVIGSNEILNNIYIACIYHFFNILPNCEIVAYRRE